MSAPERANASAMDLPIPRRRPAPVTIATLSVSSLISFPPFRNNIDFSRDIIGRLDYLQLLSLLLPGVKNAYAKGKLSRKTLQSHL